MREILEDELNDLNQLLNTIKGIESYIKLKNKTLILLGEANQQFDKMIYGFSAFSSQEEASNNANQTEKLKTQKSLLGRLFGGVGKK